jgi:GNAT superfamily N-acetyltransferase
MISIRKSTEKDLHDKTITRLTDLVNLVYGESEADLWKPETSSRTTKAEMSGFIVQQKLLIAEFDGKIVGTCKIGEQDTEICEFGMLAADPLHRGIGIGRELVSAAEGWGRKTGHQKMRLELLTPRHWKNPSKEFLKIWYTRRGYNPSYTVPFEEEFGHRINDFATDCEFTVWLKDLS